MEVYALVGKSGTGKSYKAQTIAGEFEIDFLIDDGLLINKNKIVAGSSAKREKTKYSAVKRAIFIEHDHRHEIIEAIKRYNPSKILILGTSENMVKKIIKVLEINCDYKLINIEDISTDEEISSALSSRRKMGKHVIPVPTFEIKPAFSGYFIDSMKHFVKKNEKSSLIVEKTVVRPTFSYLGKYDIKDSVIKDMVCRSCKEVAYISKVNTVTIKKERDGIVINIFVIIKACESLPDTVRSMVIKVKADVEYMSGINILEINTIIKGIIM